MWLQFRTGGSEERLAAEQSAGMEVSLSPFLQEKETGPSCSEKRPSTVLHQ